MAQINLAPQVQLMLAAKRRRRQLYFLAAFVCLLMVALWVALNFLTNQSVQNISDKESELASLKSELTIISADNSRMHSFEKRLVALNDLLSERYSWDPFFKELERLLPASTAITRLDADLDTDVIEIGGHAPVINDISQVLASLTSSEDHLTMFSQALLLSSEKYTETDAVGEILLDRYNFKIKLTKNNN